MAKINERVAALESKDELIIDRLDRIECKLDAALDKKASKAEVRGILGIIIALFSAFTAILKGL